MKYLEWANHLKHLVHNSIYLACKLDVSGCVFTVETRKDVEKKPCIRKCFYTLDLQFIMYICCLTA